MGLTKERWESQSELDYFNVPDKFVCADCFHDYAIKEFINENAVKKQCSYCGKKSTESIAAELEDVIDFICEGINAEYEDPAESMTYESAEGGYQGAEVIDSHDLIRYEIEELFDVQPEVINDIVSSMVGNHGWCYKDPYGLRREEALSLSWADFTEQVTHHTRYIFLKIYDKKMSLHDLDMIPVSKMLARLSSEILKMENDVKMIRVLDIGQQIYRARIHDKNKKYKIAKKMGTVPVNKAKYANRMSPAGIPMFYGSFEPNTAFKEIVNIYGNKRGKIVSIATFNTLKKLRVLDLCNIPEVPSLFDPGMRHLRSSILFMRQFRNEFSKSIKKNKLENIEYVPTQVFTEYIRYKYKDVKRKQIEGILYPSSRNPGGISCVLFASNEQCVDKRNIKKKLLGKKSKQPCLFLEDVERRSPYKK